MLQFRQPGVYLQEVSSGVHAITGATTSVALFVGPTLSGIDGRAIQLQNYGDFARFFGGLSPTSNLSYSVLHFFANGGGEAFVVRVPASGATEAAITLNSLGTTALGLTVTALGSGAAGANLYVEIDPFEIGADPFGAAADTTRFNLTVADVTSGAVETWTKLSTSGTDVRKVDTVVNDIGSGSRFVAADAGPALAGPPATPAVAPRPTGTVIELGALPAGPKFAKDEWLTLSITPIKADGTAGTAIQVDGLIVFAKDDLVPRTPQEFRGRLASALNGALRADPAIKTALQGLELDIGLFETGRLLRLRLGTVPVAGLTTKLNDAKVELVAKAADATHASLLADFNLTVRSTNVSRYQLGLIYDEQHAAPTAGVDGDPNGQPSDADFLAAISALETPDPYFNTLCLPDLVRGSAADATVPLHANMMACYAEAARICGLKHALLLVDPAPNVLDVDAAENWKSTQFTFSSTFAAAFWPTIRVDDPLVPGAIRSHPPSGAIAGVIARTDGNVGVWQAPAGTDAFIASAYGPSVVASDADQGRLNPIALNVIRQFPIFGTVNFGSRTLDGEDARASDWKYLPVRRTANYILQSLGQGLRWAVHQPNGEALWAQLRMNVNAFMQTLFRQGAFKGTSAADAYFVQCDGSTTTADDINKGIVNIQVGFAPLKPAEFVVVTLRQIVQANQ
ncbi:phage tail sheath family protein [Sphingomonas nostoxanthinifaciens]|uniref:phage tail sheath family protein n=1 Tax=Sphingomonas nostoxanthinifaciens TaxID=2872652 RepID=UPI001CC1DFD1|nr:phage tail sheath C-terminal domain-containing protein [Sphingomonas nostoxanthinifaciens]UAK23301.1 phage tail sheath subtilisin-like domain-containing protein [Sphingomonas nostoxanthinifaciens]